MQQGTSTTSYQVFGSVAVTQRAWVGGRVSGLCESIGNLAITEGIRLLYPFVSPKVYVVSLRNQDDSVGGPKDSILSSFWKCGCNTACVVCGLVSGVCEIFCSIGNLAITEAIRLLYPFVSAKVYVVSLRNQDGQCWGAKGLHPIKFLEVWLQHSLRGVRSRERCV